MDLAFVHKTWEKWASIHVGSSGEQAKVFYESLSVLYFLYIDKDVRVGQPLKAALLINYDPTGPSRLLSTM